MLAPAGEGVEAAMSETTRHDAWAAGDNYDAYMGRWSRLVAPRFLDWLGAPRADREAADLSRSVNPLDNLGGGDWLEVGCGTGALAAAILARGNPRSLLGIDPSAGFVATARKNLPDPRASFEVGDAQALAVPAASKDAIVSGLVLNFVPDRARALAEMKRVARPGACVGFYVWDYPGGGMQMMRAFWRAATTLDPNAAELNEDRRFPFCTPDGLTALARAAGLANVECEAIEVPTVFKDFADYWRPFTLGTGPAPGYCASLAPESRERLRQRLEQSLPRGADGAISLQARAWAVRATA